MTRVAIGGGPTAEECGSWRYYDPDSGQYISPDPIGPSGGMNRFAYARNNPLRFLDILGLLPGEPYATAEDAGRAAVYEINPTSVATDSEYGGVIYRNPDGTYSYTDPVEGEPGTGALPNELTYADVPAGATEVGDYHTHGSYGEGRFTYSEVDFQDVPAGDLVVLGTPSGAIRGHEVQPEQSTDFTWLEEPTLTTESERRHGTIQRECR